MRVYICQIHHTLRNSEYPEFEERKKIVELLEKDYNYSTVSHLIVEYGENDTPIQEFVRSLWELAKAELVIFAPGYDEDPTAEIVIQICALYDIPIKRIELEGEPFYESFEG